MKQITFKQYKAIDISILSVLLLVFEALSIYASGKWFSHSGISIVPLISLTPLVVMIMMMRWSEFAFVPALVGGISYCIACGGKPEQYLIYCVGNLFGLLALLIIKKVGKDAVREKTLYLVLTSISTYLFITIGRWMVSLIFDPTIKTLMAFITTDIISLVVLIVGVVSLRKSDGILEDQKSYLLRLDRERRELEEARLAMASSAYIPNNDDEDEDDFECLDEDDIPSDHLPDASDPEEHPEPEEILEPEEIPEPEIPETEYLPDAGEMPVWSPDEEIAPDNDYNNDEFNSEDKI
jgi:hypothetical protein